MFKSNRTVLTEKLKESLASVLPITAVVFLLCFTVAPVPNGLLMSFVVGAVMLVLGMGLFTLGTDIAMTPIGEHVGTSITKSKKIWFIVLICLIAGVIITVAEPDLQVLASQVPGIPDAVLIITVAAGVGVFLVAALLRIVFRVRLSYLLIGFYAVVFALAAFAPSDILSVAFDSGGVTTGPMTVPFIMALGVGAAAIRTDKNAESDSFGLVALCSIGPVIAVLILGMLYPSVQGESAYSPAAVIEPRTSTELCQSFAASFPTYFKEVASALLPVMIFFIIFNFAAIKLKKEPLIRMGVGILYTYSGLVLFLTGANAGFMPVGKYLGGVLGGLEYSWIIIPVGMVIGYFIVDAEPAVHVLVKQVYELTSGMIPQKAMKLSLSAGVAVSVGLAMLRVVLGIPILYFLIPGYGIAIILSFFVSPMFTAVAFDSGGVASGPMTAAFLLPLAMGACGAMGGSMGTDAFGVVALVAMTPLITIQLLGMHFRIKSAVSKKADTVPVEEDIIEMEV